MNRTFIFLFSLSVIALSCKPSQSLTEFRSNDPLEKHEYFKGKAKLELTTEKGNQKAQMHLRLKKDSLIWISITNKVEAARILISPDSIKFMDRLNKKFYSNSIDSMGAMFSFNLDFDLIQNILTSRTPSENVNWRKVGNETVGMEKRNDWMIEYEVESDSKNLKNVNIQEIQGPNKIMIEYFGTFAFDDGAIAEQMKSDAFYSRGKAKGNIKAKLTYDKFNFANKEDLNFSFRIPSKYERL